MFRRRGNGNYAYVVTRVRAKKSSLLKEESYAKMLMMSVPEISRFISESGYQQEMTELAGRIEGVDLVEHATYSNMAKVYRSILQSATGELRDMLSAYLEKWDIWNLKVILRGKTYGMDNDHIREDLVVAGELSSADLEKLLSAGTEEEILALFGKMAKVVIPQEVMAAYRTSGNLAQVEDYLDKLHYIRLIGKTDQTSAPARLFQTFIRAEIDTVNLGTILKLKAEGIHGDEAMKYIVPGGKQIDKQLATQLANAETIPATAADLAQLDFYDEIKGALEQETSSLRDIVAGMKRYQIRQAKRFSHLYPLSIIPILDFMIHKEIEVTNIRTIARGTASGIDREKIKGLLVM